VRYVLNVCTEAASRNAVSDPGKAERLGRASIGMSIAGFVVSIIIVITVPVVFGILRSSYSSY